ncbi:MAG: hypothetical protein WKG07_44720 [Hymenobacter sp.]
MRTYSPSRTSASTSTARWCCTRSASRSPRARSWPWPAKAGLVSTLLQLIAGLAQPSAGEVRIAGSRVRGPAVALVPGHLGVAYLSQKSDLPKFLRVEQVLRYAQPRAAPGGAAGRTLPHRAPAGAAHRPALGRRAAARGPGPSAAGRAPVIIAR